MFLKDEQLKSHEAKLKQISTELAEHRSYPPDKKLKGKEVDDYKLKDHYLEFEVCLGTIMTFIFWVWKGQLLLHLGYSLEVLHFSPYLPRSMFLLDKWVAAVPEAAMCVLFGLRTSCDLIHEYSSSSVKWRKKMWPSVPASYIYLKRW